MTPARSAGIPESLPILPVRSTLVFPLGVAGVQVGTASTLEMLAAHDEPGVIVAVVVAPGEPDDPIDAGALRKVATAARVSERLNLPGGTVQATLQGLARVELREIERPHGHLVARARPARERPARDDVARGLIARILNALEVLSSEVERIPREVPRILRMNLGDPGRFADLVATLANFSVAGKDRVLQALNIAERLGFECDELESQLARVRRLSDDAPTRTAASATDPGPRAADLRQRIKLLQTELGEVDPLESEVVDLLRRVEGAGMPVRAVLQARSEIERLRAVGAASTDAAEIRSYVDVLLRMPWRRMATDGPGAIDLDRIEHRLDRELLGLDEPKERLLDHLAVARLREDLSGPIPCIVGPPDVGKRSLVRALADGLGRPLARLSLAGQSESMLVGVRRARPGAQPGRISSLLSDVRVADPVFLFEEADAIGAGNSDGDPVEAIEELLDGEARSAFVDRYLDVPFDLSHVFFVAVAQDFHKIPRNLRARMFEIRIAGYTPEEKIEIAKRRLIPRLIHEHGLRRRDVRFPKSGLRALAHGYARDSGLASVRRSIETLLRTRARARAAGDNSAWKFDPPRIEEVLGLPRYVATAAESAPEVGVVTGLAWTASGGELMFIEALRMPGTGRLIITGLLGEVMRESVNAAYSYVRSRGDELGIDEEDFRESDVHVHFPVGAIPKDGPSAGVAVTLAIASTLSNRPVRHDVAMTGEVTLRGKVLEVGGIKEKVLAAHRAHIRHVILPAGNERELRDVPDDVRAAITFHFVERMDDIVRLALSSRSRPARTAGRANGEPVLQPRAARRR
ncbi:MAG: LON peptidase substrate-binding domain-containing protein [Gemmatimonadetes bacterium]|nr:LON peptidase substrate-binding domain-containing protein [Gemmatimonadota bacterium]